ncbi:signal recognition particle-docking protein FtsY [Dictyobacter aurantiacus]|uniref:Signal recognition particle receptor FtsY n=1 Tax=Dictyobacter aurantiacus TaxID=1936993 RepID=A0A401Z8Y1_9CHLR|nr:signal recognition particle-docking protein FtsY [Dictyobacter aurantiacus]GCE03321.1 signal recognition particle-docking protein FtsY [Dictyobacter aurantiacus]
MLNRFFGQKPQEDPKQNQPKGDTAPAPTTGQQPPAEQRFSFLGRTRQIFNRLGNTVQETDTITDSLWDELEESLLGADVGPSTTLWLIERLRQRVSDENMRTGGQVQQALREELSALLGKSSSLRFSKQSPLTVILVIGVNGSGKTTSIAKMAYRLKREGHSVMLAAADTFRAAAIDQLQEWGNRVEVPVISQKPNSDPGAVVFDALQAAQSRGSDVLIVDTAGRLHTKFNLMEELKKINKIIQRFVPDGPHELLMVIDATTGQNALLQARKFAEDIGLTGVIITKMDSTAKGGFAFAVADDLGVPIKFIGTGEKVENLMPFEPQNFVAALFAQQ